MDKTCKNCKNYDPFESGLGNGECKKVETVATSKSDTIYMFAEHFCIVGENFGCIHFEQK